MSQRRFRLPSRPRGLSGRSLGLCCPPNRAMGARTQPIFRSRGVEPRTARLLALAAALVIVFAAPLAHAAVPMCDELAQTIAAPPPLVPLKPGTISPVDCGDSDPSKVGAPSAPEPPRQLTAPELPDRTLAVAYGLPPR